MWKVVSWFSLVVIAMSVSSLQYGLWELRPSLAWDSKFAIVFSISCPITLSKIPSWQQWNEQLRLIVYPTDLPRVLATFAPSLTGGPPDAWTKKKVPSPNSRTKKTQKLYPFIDKHKQCQGCKKMIQQMVPQISEQNKPIATSFHPQTQHWHSSSHNHGNETWVPPIVVTFQIPPFSTSMIIREKE